MSEHIDGLEPEELNQPEPEAVEPEALEPEAHDHDNPPEPEEDDLEISFGDEGVPSNRGDNSDLVKHLRAEVRRRDEELSTLRKAQPAPAPVDPGPKPTLESCDYDEGKFEEALDAWKERKRQAENVGAQAREAERAEQEKFQARLQVYHAGKEQLRAKDFDVAEAAVTSKLSPMQAAIALRAAAEPAKLLYALGRYPAKLDELAKITDGIDFAVAITKLEGQLKVTQRRAPPEPDTPPRGSAPISGNKVDKHLEKLEAAAARTGDRTEVVRYKRAQAAKAQARK